MAKYRIGDFLTIEFEDLNNISRNSVRFSHENGNISLDDDVQYAIAIILQNSVLYGNYISMKNVFGKLRDLGFYAQTEDYQSFAKTFRRQREKHKFMQAEIETCIKGYKVKYKEITVSDYKNRTIDLEIIANAGAHWYETSKKVGNRFEKLLPKREIMPLAIYVQSDEKKEQKLLEAISSTNEHLYLIGEGGIGKTTALFSIMKAAYDSQEDESIVDQIPLFIELSRAYDPDDFEKGRSKFIEHTIKKQIENSLHDRIDFGDQIEKLLAFRKNEKPEYVLLLDGLNEVSRDELDGRAIVTMVMAEIRRIISEWDNVRVILTSRSKENRLNENIKPLELSGIKDEDIKAYLKNADFSENRIDTIKNNTKLMQILSIPLFLVLYANIDGERELLTRGEILHAFFTQKKDSYSARNRLDDIRKDREKSGRPESNKSITPQMLCFLMDFIMSSIAWEMVRKNDYQISQEEILNIVTIVLNDKSDSSLCGRYGKKCFKEYSIKVSSIAKQIDSVFGKEENDEDDRAEMVADGITDCLVKQLGVLVINNDKEYEVVHQHVRDYFAALYQINILRLAVFINEEVKDNCLARKCLTGWIKKPLPRQVLIFIGEALGETHNAPWYDKGEKAWVNEMEILDPKKEPERTLVKRGFGIFRDRSGRFAQNDGNGVWNLFQILKLVRNDLSGEDLSYLDLSVCRANGYRLGNGSFAAIMTGAILNDDFFFPFSCTVHLESVRYSPDGKHIVAVSKDNMVSIWNAETYEEVGKIEGDNGLRTAQYSPDGMYIVTVFWNGTAKIWSSETYEEVGELKGHTNIVTSAQYSPDGMYIVTASMDETAKIWSSETYEEVGELKGHTNIVTSAQYSPDGKYIVTTSDDKTAKIWNAETLEEVGELKGDTNYVTSAQYSPDGQHIVIVSWDETAKIWSSETYEEVGELKGHNNSLISAQYSPDGMYIVTVFWNGTAKIWSSETYEEVGELKGHNNSLISAQYSPDGMYIVTASMDETAKIWSSKTYEEVGELKGPNNGLRTAQYSPDGMYIVTASMDETAKIWSSETYEEVGELKGHTNNVTSAQYSPDGKHIVTASKDKTIRIWNAVTYEEVGELKGDNGLRTAQYSPDGMYIVTASMDETAKIWSSETYEEVGELKGHTNNVMSAQYSPDGKYIVTTSDDKTAKIWNAETLEEVGELKGHTNNVTSAQYSPDGKHIVTDSLDGTTKIWSSETYEEVGELKGHNGLKTAQYSPDGMYIVTASVDGTAKIWSSETYEEVGELKGHTNYVTSAQYSPDGKYIVTTSLDGTAKIWSSDSFELIIELPNISGLEVKGLKISENNYISKEMIRNLKMYGADVDDKLSKQYESPENSEKTHRL